MDNVLYRGIFCHKHIFNDKKYKHFTNILWMSMSEYLYFWRISGENVILPLIPAIVSCNWNKWINGKLTLVWWSLLLFMFLIVSHFLSCLGFTAILGSYQNILQFWAGMWNEFQTFSCLQSCDRLPHRFYILHYRWKLTFMGPVRSSPHSTAVLLIWRRGSSQDTAKYMDIIMDLNKEDELSPAILRPQDTPEFYR